MYMKQKSNIRFATPQDIAALATLATTTFTQSYQHELSTGDIKQYCDLHFSRQAISRDFKGGTTYYLLVFEDDTPIGYAKLGLNEKPEQLAGKNPIQIDKIYFLEDKQRSGYGAQLMEHILQLAKENNFQALWVKVWEKNTAGLGFYQKMGFEKIGTIEFDFVGEIMQDHFLVREV